MNVVGRQAVCDELAYTNEASQRADLMDPALTTGTLIAFLEELLNKRGGVWLGQKLIVTSVRRDHPTPDGPNGHEGGNAIDFSQNGPDDAVVHLVQDCQTCPDARGIELNGPFMAAAEACGGYSAATKLFAGDPGNDHLHVQVVGY